MKLFWTRLAETAIILYDAHLLPARLCAWLVTIACDRLEPKPSGIEIDWRLTAQPIPFSPGRIIKETPYIPPYGSDPSDYATDDLGRLYLPPRTVDADPPGIVSSSCGPAMGRGSDRR